MRRRTDVRQRVRVRRDCHGCGSHAAEFGRSDVSERCEVGSPREAPPGASSAAAGASKVARFRAHGRPAMPRRTHVRQASKGLPAPRAQVTRIAAADDGRSRHCLIRYRRRGLRVRRGAKSPMPGRAEARRCSSGRRAKKGPTPLALFQDEGDVAAKARRDRCHDEQKTENPTLALELADEFLIGFGDLHGDVTFQFFDDFRCFVAADLNRPQRFEQFDLDTHDNLHCSMGVPIGCAGQAGQ